METDVTIEGMQRKLTERQIEAVCAALLVSRRLVTVREVMAELRTRHGAAGRTERVNRILRRVEEGSAVAPEPFTVSELRELLRQAEARARLAEEREERHQDYWAERYADKVVELEQRYAGISSPRGVTHEQYLRIHHRAAELARRLAQYEPVDPVTTQQREA